MTLRYKKLSVCAFLRILDHEKLLFSVFLGGWRVGEHYEFFAKTAKNGFFGPCQKSHFLVPTRQNPSLGSSIWRVRGQNSRVFHRDFTNSILNNFHSTGFMMKIFRFVYLRQNSRFASCNRCLQNATEKAASNRESKSSKPH